MKTSEAVALLEQGGRVARSCWNGIKYLFVIRPGDFTDEEKINYPLLSLIVVKHLHRQQRELWQPHHTDLQAEDWEQVSEQLQ
jgi:hypothetical protein